MSTDDVGAYYDASLERRVIDYRLRGNRRLELASRFAAAHVLPTSRVLDLGCGIGVVTERVARAAPRGSVLGVDLSRASISYASKTVRRKNVAFVQADIVDEFSRIRELLGGAADIVMLIDAIEHLPPETRPQLLQSVRSVLGEHGILIVTYPSPQYQRHLREHAPDDLQIIDETIEIHSLVAEAQAASLTLQEYRLVDVWLGRQYVHCVFGAGEAVEALVPSGRDRMTAAVRSAGRLLARPYRRRRYLFDGYDVADS